ncbi:hypothetical protein ACLOJK_029583, partial [Asimina triloba]
MANATTLALIPKINKDNYDNWCIQMRALLGAQAVMDIVEDGYKEAPSKEGDTSKGERHTKDEFEDFVEKDLDILNLEANKDPREEDLDNKIMSHEEADEEEEARQASTRADHPRDHHRPKQRPALVQQRLAAPETCPRVVSSSVRRRQQRPPGFRQQSLPQSTIDRSPRLSPVAPIQTRAVPIIVGTPIRLPLVRPSPPAPVRPTRSLASSCRQRPAGGPHRRRLLQTHLHQPLLTPIGLPTPIVHQREVSITADDAVEETHQQYPGSLDPDHLPRAPVASVARRKPVRHHHSSLVRPEPRSTRRLHRTRSASSRSVSPEASNDRQSPSVLSRHPPSTTVQWILPLGKKVEHHITVLQQHMHFGVLLVSFGTPVMQEISVHPQ